jgi:hypothetical protein
MINLVELIQKDLGYQELYKIDPNTQDIKLDDKNYGVQMVTQAGIPAVLCGLLNLLESSAGIAEILHGESSNWLETIFGKRTEELINRIAIYSNTTPLASKQETEHIANDSVRLLKAHVQDKSDYTSIAAFCKEQRANALFYLPASIDLGSLINDNQLDDRTHKMEGPISSLMHSLEKQF